VDPIVDLAPGAEANPIAVALATRIRERLQQPRAARVFRLIRATVRFVAQDTTNTATLRFDHGRLTIHEGAIGIPAVTFCGDEADLLRLRELTPLPRLGLPVPLPGKPAGQAALRHLGAQLARGELTIYGLVAHPRLVTRLLRLLATEGR
jgi:hypothetical protein